MRSTNRLDFGVRKTWAILFTVSVVAVVACGYGFYRVSAQRIYLDKYSELEAIGNLKVGEISQWRKERLADATKNMESPLFRKATAAWLKDSGNPVLRDEFVQRLRLEQRTQGYADALLLDLCGRILLAAKDDPGPVDGTTMKAVVQAIAAKEAVLSDLFRCPDGNMSIDAVGPVSDADNQPIAIVALRSDAKKYLCPLIQSWPIPSQSAETLLVRKDGDDVLYLNELRFQTDTALSLRIPLTRGDIPAVQAVQGKQGMFEGKGYRGMEVLANLQPVPGSTWFMVAQVDTSEILAEVNNRAWVSVVFVVLFILFTAAMGAFLYWQRQARAYRLLYASEEDRHKAQEALRETKEYLKNVIGYANTPIIVWDPQFRIFRINHACESLTGREANDVIGQSLDILFPPLLVESSLELIKKTVEGERWEAVEIAILHRDGSVRTVLWSLAPILAPDEKTPVAMIAQGQDITERKRAEEALKRIEWMLSPKPSPATIKDDQNPVGDHGYGDLTKLNYGGIILQSVGKDILRSITDEYLDLMGTSSATYEKNGDYACGIFSSSWCRLMDRASRNLCAPDDNVAALNSGKWLCHESCWTCCSKEAIAKRAPVDIECNGGIWLYAVPIFAGNEVIGAINVGHGDPPKDPAKLRELANAYHVDYDDLVREANAYDSRPAYIVEMAKNRLQASARLIGALVERKRVEDVLRESEARYRALVENIPQKIFMKSRDCKWTSINKNFARGLGIRPEEVVGKVDWDLFPKKLADKYHADDVRVMETGQAEEFEERYVEGGKETWVNTIKTPVRDERGTIMGILGIFWDITERKQAEDMLRNVLEDLERSNKELEQFAYVASHDLQEPLRMISSYTQLLAERYDGQLDEKAQKYIDYAVDGAVRMQRLINDLLAYSRVGTRNNPIETTDAHSVLGEAIGNLAAVIEENKAIITNEDFPMVRADASQLVQVFQNLLSNAIKFRGEDFPRVHVSARDEGRKWVFSVKDNGIGIDRQYADRIFVIFQRLHTRQEYPGTGIGLAVCKRIVERHGGKIWFESEPGKGSTFFFTIPK